MWKMGHRVLGLTRATRHSADRQITEAGAGQIPNVGQLVRCKYTGRLLKTGEVFEKMEDTGYRIGDNDTTPGGSGGEGGAKR